MQRSDLTTDQLAQLYYDRGFSRRLYVNDYPMAQPQCAVLDYRELERLSPNHPNIEKIKDHRGYQFARFTFFPNPPSECKSGAKAYAAELGDCMGARDANGACVVKYKS